MIIIDDIAQQSPEWYQLKASVFSSSEFKKIITSKGKPSTSRFDLAYKLAGEKITGMKEETYQSFDMKLGIARESEARRTYEFITGKPVRQVAFVFKDDKRAVGCSPDGLLPDSGLEIKCPNLANHSKQLIEGKLPDDKFCQIHGSMWVCGVATWTFFSYYPGLPAFILEVKRDYSFTSALEIEMKSFLEELEETYNKLRTQ